MKIYSRKCHPERSRGEKGMGFDFAQPDKRCSVSVLVSPRA
ncbi:hypothetical protein ACI75Y_08610 [Capnocytophaga stomatis]